MEVAQGSMELIYVGVGILTTGIPLLIAIIALRKVIVDETNKFLNDID